jgi:hypothetical protein
MVTGKDAVPVETIESEDGLDCRDADPRTSRETPTV